MLVKNKRAGYVISERCQASTCSLRHIRTLPSLHVLATSYQNVTKPPRAGYVISERYQAPTCWLCHIRTLTCLHVLVTSFQNVNVPPCVQALCQIICLFMYFYYLQKSRNVMFSGTVSDYLFIYVFLLFPEVLKCYVFWHCVRLFVYLCISIISRSPEMLCFQTLCQIICLYMCFHYFQKS